MGNYIDLTGQKFGKLTVIERDMQYRDKGVYWKCVCECGNEKTILGTSLRSGATKSCGCLQKIGASKANTKNLIGQKFGKLTVIEKTEKRSSCGRIIWKCICDCGNECEATTIVLKSGDKQSCGCIGKSRGEDKITNILKENNILFEREKKFSTCKFPSTNAFARFDFYVNNQYLIEFDGAQHFSQAHGWEDVVETQMRDNFKNQWCKENNIPLIRIPYTHVDDIVLEDLQLNTSKFIVKDDI